MLHLYRLFRSIWRHRVVTSWVKEPIIYFNQTLSPNFVTITALRGKRNNVGYLRRHNKQSAMIFKEKWNSLQWNCNQGYFTWWIFQQYAVVNVSFEWESVSEIFMFPFTQIPLLFYSGILIDANKFRSGATMFGETNQQPKGEEKGGGGSFGLISLRWLEAAVFSRFP